MTKHTKDLSYPIEVKLIDDVKSCTDCAWFWGGIPPYGPFPAFDWEDPYPKALKDGPPHLEPSDKTGPQYWTQVKQVQGPRVEPAVLRGCRKAPIMTIGINPNMTAFFAGAGSSTWAYPYFKRPETYAYYYRHATIYQESFDLDDLRDQVIPGSEIRAEHDGKVVVNRSDTYRWLSLEFTYCIDGEDIKVRREESWLPEQRLVIFARDTRGAETLFFAGDETSIEAPSNTLIATDSLVAEDVSLGVSGIRKGDLIAARIEQTEKEDIRLFANKTGYYERVIPVLEAFNAYLKKEGFNRCKLEVGEDVSMHDMIGCASPGWGKRYKIPTDWISEKCVDHNRYMFDQMIQSKPRVIVIVSGSSLDMFAPSFKRLGGKFELAYQDKDPFELLQETATHRHLLSWDDKQDAFRSRVIITPHFSYIDNFKQQSRFKLEAWEEFQSTFSDDVACLKRHKRVPDRRDDEKKQIVFLKHTDDPIEKDISTDAWQALLNCHIHPYELIDTALKNEHEYDALISDPKAQHLDRAPGACSFCVNDLWQFPEGCDYDLA